jgi:hypothetical protein
MNEHKILAGITLLALIITACSQNTPTPNSQSTLDAVYTSVALTLTAETVEPSATPIPSSTPTATPQETNTSVPTATTIPTTLNSAVNVTGCDSSIYVSDVTIPDGKVLSGGEAFVKTWSIKNTGTCTWTTSYSIAFYSGNAMSGETTNLSASVSPGGSVNVSVAMLAPLTAGEYTGYWRMKNAAGAAFGESVYVQIVVAGGTVTATFTPTATGSQVSKTATATQTATATTTKERTRTSTPTQATYP